MRDRQISFASAEVIGERLPSAWSRFPPYSLTFAHIFAKRPARAGPNI
jgi:hypothetical protein